MVSRPSIIASLLLVLTEVSSTPCTASRSRPKRSTPRSRTTPRHPRSLPPPRLLPLLCRWSHSFPPPSDTLVPRSSRSSGSSPRTQPGSIPRCGTRTEGSESRSSTFRRSGRPSRYDQIRALEHNRGMISLTRCPCLMSHFGSQAAKEESSWGGASGGAGAGAMDEDLMESIGGQALGSRKTYDDNF